MDLSRAAAASKRSLSSSTETIPSLHKRPKSSSNPKPSSHISFRMLCHTSRIGGIIGKSGSTIQHLQLQTQTKIKIEDTDSSDRVIVITGSAALKPSLLLIRRVREGKWDGEVEVSAAQEGLLIVFEKVLEVAAELDGVYIGPGRVVSCRLIVKKGTGKIVRAHSGCMIKVSNAETGGEPTDELLEIEGEVSAVKRAIVDISKSIQDRECVERNGVTDISRFDNQSEFDLKQDVTYPRERSLRMPSSSSSINHDFSDHMSPMESLRLPTIEGNGVTKFRRLDNHIEFDPRQPLIYPRERSLHMPMSRSSVNHDFGDRISPMESLRLPTQNVLRQEEISFKICCPNDKVGKVLGKGGSIIKALKSETGATISIGALIDDCAERLITVKAMENVESQHSQAQKAMVLVFSRFGEASTEKDSDPDATKGTDVVARLVVPKKQIGCLMGKGGAVISEMRKSTRTGIHILKGTENPKCASEDDQVVEITGEFVKVQDAICHVTNRLRDYVFPRKLLSVAGTRSIPSTVPEADLYDRARDYAPKRLFRSDDASPNLYLSKHSNQLHITDAHNKDYAPHHHQFSTEFDKNLSPRGWATQTMSGTNKRDFPDCGGVSSNRRSLDLGSGSMAALITNATIEIKIPDTLIGFVYGENGSNLAKLRQISGAHVMLLEPRPGSRERIIVISGTPDETQAAQSLLQAFILTGSS